jgi:hypothetical protein
MKITCASREMRESPGYCTMNTMNEKKGVSANDDRGEFRVNVNDWCKRHAGEQREGVAMPTTTYTRLPGVKGGTGRRGIHTI